MLLLPSNERVNGGRSWASVGGRRRALGFRRVQGEGDRRGKGKRQVGVEHAIYSEDCLCYIAPAARSTQIAMRKYTTRAPK